MNTNREDALLHPVECIDCKQEVPFGWVRYGRPACAENIGSSGIQYGHRLPREIYDECEADYIEALVAEGSAT